jgi:hypothetical protein
MRANLGIEDISLIESELTVRNILDLEEWKLRKETAKTIIRAFVVVNFSVLVLVLILYITDVFFIYTSKIDPSGRLINSNVIISIVGATTVQFGAVAIAVSNWLFPKGSLIEHPTAKSPTQRMSEGNTPK